MMKWIWNTCKLTILFVACLLFFYLSLRSLHAEYEKHRQNELEDYQQLKVHAWSLRPQMMLMYSDRIMMKQMD